MSSKKKFIITTRGGIGNQILQYALFLYLKENGNEVELFLPKNSIGKSFGININSTKRVAIIIAKKEKGIQFLFKVLGRILNRKYKQFPVFNYTLVGFLGWNDYRFVYDVLPTLKHNLAFPIDPDIRNERIKKYMSECNSVSIHVRRGDYQNSLYWRRILGDICDSDYYNNAIKEVEKRIESPVYFVFSDDIDWVKQYINIPSPTYIDWNTGENSFRDMELMANCKTNIIANSTFSLCSSLLNVHKNPLRIAPAKWLNLNNDDTKDKYLNEKWVVIDNVKPQISIIDKVGIQAKDITNIKVQYYTDFEVITSSEVQGDKRFHHGRPTGNHIYDYTIESSVNFKNRKYLGSWLEKLYSAELNN